MPSEYVAVVLGLVASTIGIIPLGIANRLTLKREPRVGIYTMYGMLAAQGVSMVWMVVTIIICGLRARPLMLWYAFPAIVWLLVLNVAGAFWVIRSRRRR